MHTHQKHKLTPPELKINDVAIEIVNTSKLLGVEISDTMNWYSQCDHVVSKLRSLTYLFTMLRDIVTEDVLKLVYFA